MAQWPTIPLTPIPASGPEWPARAEVGPLTLVGPTGENQQPSALDQRTETMRLLLNQILDMTNRIRDFFLDRDGSSGTAAQPGIWMRNDFDVGGFKIVKTALATAPRDAITFEQLQDVQFEGEDELEQILDTRVVKLDGSAALVEELNAGNFRVTNVGAATLAAHMVRKDTVDADVATLLNTFLPRSGALAMTFDLNFDGPLVVDPGFIPNNLADPTVPGDLVNKRYLDTQSSIFIGQDVPVATVLPWAGSEGSVPVNFLLCDGREVSRFVHQNLFNIIGVAYGSPSSGSVFRLPDLRGRIVAGRDKMGGGASAGRLTNIDAAALGGVFGSETHLLNANEIPAHTHTYDDHLFTSGAGGGLVGADDGTDANNQNFDESRVTGGAGSGAAHPNVQPSFTLNYIIRF